VEKHLPENGLWGVVNNAGQYSSPGCFEWIPTYVLEKVKLKIVKIDEE
jgi:3-hydroxybutyrate dehydrogenase